MNYLSVENLSKSYAEKLLFREITFGLERGEKTGLIAKNGSGKTTLLKIIAGRDFKDSGTVSLRNGIRVGYLPQAPIFDSEKSIRDWLPESDITAYKVIGDYHRALEIQAKADSAENRAKVQHLSNLMDKYSAWDFDRRAEEMLNRFGISHLDQPLQTLSGGQMKRLALALLLLNEPDLMLLDEPTNHLDLEMIEWLESYLAKPHITLLMVTHDRYFLDRVCNTILELDEGNLYRYEGNYSYFLQKRNERIEQQSAEKEKAAKAMKKELEWMRRMPKARTHKSKARIDSFYELKEKATSGTSDRELTLNVNMQRLGGKILEVRNITKSFGNLTVVKNFSFIFKKGERIGIIGKNGAGKSTFLNLLTGLITPDSGEIVRGETLQTGYYTQQGLQVPGDKRVIDVVTDIAEVVVSGKNRPPMSASQFLNYFLFPPQMQQQPVSKLSGGERRRLYLLTVLIKNPNFLILDEPTNDLDIVTLNKLEEFLSGYKGCLIIVSHDRFFLDRLTDHLFIFEGAGKIKDFYGNYSDYKINKEEKEKAEPVKTERKKRISKENRRKGLSYKEQKEYETLEKEIEELEAEKRTLEEQLNGGTEDYRELEKLSRNIAELIRLIDEKTERWMELEEKKEIGS